MFRRKINLYAILVLFIGLLVSTTAATAQVEDEEDQGAATIIGLVVDSEAQQPVSGVELQIEGTEKTAQTNDQGQFTFSDIEQGTYTITASPEGYEEVSKEVELSSSEKEVTIELTPSGS